MSRALVVYHSETGNTEKMALAIAEGIKEAGVDVDVKKVDEAGSDDLIAADAIVLGSPTRFASMSSRMKAFIEESIGLYPDKLRNKVGAAFTSSAGRNTGNQTTLISLIEAMLLHRMVVIGHQSGAFGAISVREPDEKCLAECREFGGRIADFIKR